MGESRPLVAVLSEHQSRGRVFYFPILLHAILSDERPALSGKEAPLRGSVTGARASSWQSATGSVYRQTLSGWEPPQSLGRNSWSSSTTAEEEGNATCFDSGLIFAAQERLGWQKCRCLGRRFHLLVRVAATDSYYVRFWWCPRRWGKLTPLDKLSPSFISLLARSV
ncbi:hypothetical protein MTO96_044219 [Rhipicephalus appendiculatus]